MKLRPALLVAFSALLLTGCLYSREFSDLRRDIEHTYPEADFDREVYVSIGPRFLHSVGWIAGLVPEPEAQMARDYLYDIRKIKVGVYRTEYLPPLDEVDLPTLQHFTENGWEVAVKVRERDEMIWVLYREQGETIRDLYVVVLSDEELVMTRIEGRLNDLFLKVVADHDFIADIDWDW